MPDLDARTLKSIARGLRKRAIAYRQYPVGVPGGLQVAHSRADTFELLASELYTQASRITQKAKPNA